MNQPAYEKILDAIAAKRAARTPEQIAEDETRIHCGICGGSGWHYVVPVNGDPDIKPSKRRCLCNKGER